MYMQAPALQMPRDHYKLLPLPVKTGQPSLIAALLLSLLLFFYGLPLIRLIDPAAGIIDAGVLSLLFVAVLAVLAFTAASLWLGGRLWPGIAQYRKQHFQQHFNALLPWQKILFCMAAYYLLLYAFVCCLAAVM